MSPAVPIAVASLALVASALAQWLVARRFGDPVGAVVGLAVWLPAAGWAATELGADDVVVVVGAAAMGVGLLRLTRWIARGYD